MVSLDLKDDSFKELFLVKITQQCFPLEDDVVKRLAQSCTRLQKLKIINSKDLEEESRMSVACLIQEIIKNNPPLTHLNLEGSRHDNDGNESAGTIIMEALLNSSISTIENLRLNGNSSWFNYGYTDREREREGAIEMLTEVIGNMSSSLQ